MNSLEGIGNLRPASSLFFCVLDFKLSFLMSRYDMPDSGLGSHIEIGNHAENTTLRVHGNDKQWY